MLTICNECENPQECGGKGYCPSRLAAAQLAASGVAGNNLQAQIEAAYGKPGSDLYKERSAEANQTYNAAWNMAARNPYR